MDGAPYYRELPVHHRVILQTIIDNADKAWYRGIPLPWYQLIADTLSSEIKKAEPDWIAPLYESHDIANQIHLFYEQYNRGPPAYYPVPLPNPYAAIPPCYNEPRGYESQYRSEHAVARRWERFENDTLRELLASGQYEFYSEVADRMNQISRERNWWWGSCERRHYLGNALGMRAQRYSMRFSRRSNVSNQPQQGAYHY